MGTMMRNNSVHGCKCCNDWDALNARAYDKRMVEREIREELWESVDWMKWLAH